MDKIIACAIGLAVAVCPGIARAQDDGAINGTYRVQSNGEWAQTNDRFHDEAVVVSTWTISTTCNGLAACAGEVKSDQGWTAPIYRSTLQWYVKRTVSGWQQCPDGTFADGLQIYRFYPVGVDGMVDRHSTTYAGFDITTGPSGACGVNRPLEIRIPLRLTVLP